jgi:hypothetical protein
MFRVKDLQASQKYVRGFTVTPKSGSQRVIKHPRSNGVMEYWSSGKERKNKYFFS